MSGAKIRTLVGSDHVQAWGGTVSTETTPILEYGEGFSSLTDTAAGNQTWNFSVNQPDANYIVDISGYSNTATWQTHMATTLAVGSFIALNRTNGTLTDQIYTVEVVRELS